MDKRVFRSIREPVREAPSWDERWNGPDAGLIICWEVGRQQAELELELAEKAKNQELPVLDWKGGVEKKLKGRKYGSLNYLATWQGLRRDDLDINLDDEVELVCSRTGMRVVYTGDMNKYASA